VAFVNLPPNFQDIFYNITDRIAKLETGPNQAMYTAEAAQGAAFTAQALALQSISVATNAQVQAINAGIQANNAASQATIAQSQATIASSQATAAQVTANGKNKVYYSTSGPGSTANTVGDIWYQYGTSGVYLNKVIAQFSGAGGTSWTSVTVSGLVIANIDAGSITTGTLSAITITAGSGANSFNVSSSGVMTAQGVWVKGNITADSGTFTGTIQAGTGYFGNFAGGNYWSIGSSGITGVGTAEITGGKINGSSIAIGSGSTVFSVSNAGVMSATGANISGTVTANAGTIGGFTLSATSIFAGTSLVLNTDGTLSGGNSSTLFYGYVNIGGGFPSGARLQVQGNSSFTGNIIATGDITAQNNYYYPFPDVVSGTANIRRLPGSTPAGRLVDNGASSQRYKHDIVNLIDVPELNPRNLYELPVRAFRYNLDYLSSYDDRYDMLIPGFIAEEVDEFYPLAADYEPTIGIHTWNERMIIPAMLALIQEQDARIKLLEGN
jgi:hypothetical protein